MKERITEKIVQAAVAADKKPIAGILFTLTVVSIILACAWAYNGVVPAYQ